jgi:Fe-S cluster assembly iron-binding protein IscA
MLTVTAQAAQAINDLVSERPDAGLRISSQSSDSSGLRLELTLTTGPAPEDQVIDEHGSRVFVDEQVAELLSDKTLDATSQGEEGVSFTLRP